MFGGDNGTPVYPGFMGENQFQYDANASTQLQLFGNFPASCSGAPMNFMGNEHISVLNRPTNENITVLNRPTKRNRDAAEDISRQQQQQQLQISLNNNFFQDEPHHRSVSIPNRNPVSTGLRLSYDDDEHNSSVTSASGSMTAALPVILSLNDNLRFEIDRQHEELDHYIRLQEEQIAKGVREMKQRQMASFLNVIENGVCKKIQEKEMEIENMNRKNRELLERIKQVSVESSTWQSRAKYNESMVSVLRNNLKQAIAQGANQQPKEGCGDSEVEDAASSYIDENCRVQRPSSRRRGLTCKSCNVKEVLMS
ncbi:RING-type E3 ubiquitin transferase [Ranunculus cassubicifolius]